MSSSGVTFLHTLVFALQRCHWGPLYLYSGHYHLSCLQQRWLGAQLLVLSFEHS